MQQAIQTLKVLNHQYLQCLSLEMLTHTYVIELPIFEPKCMTSSIIVKRP